MDEISASESDSDSEEEDEDAKLLSRDIQKEFYTLVPLLHQRDPSIYQQKSPFFSEPTATEQSKDGEKDKKTKKMTLSDVLRKNVTDRNEDDDHEDEESENDDDDDHKRGRHLNYKYDHFLTKCAP